MKKSPKMLGLILVFKELFDKAINEEQAVITKSNSEKAGEVDAVYIPLRKRLNKVWDSIINTNVQKLEEIDRNRINTLIRAEKRIPSKEINNLYGRINTLNDYLQQAGKAIEQLQEPKEKFENEIKASMVVYFKEIVADIEAGKIDKVKEELNKIIQGYEEAITLNSDNTATESKSDTTISGALEEAKATDTTELTEADVAAVIPEVEELGKMA